jgi:hypothetical protein
MSLTSYRAAPPRVTMMPAAVTKGGVPSRRPYSSF